MEADGTKRNSKLYYDYARQCWVVNGRVDVCHHPVHMKPTCCYSGEHANEWVGLTDRWYK
jgi:hypothetical protein